jgi:tetratricopeptide (TPR) repeat protein
MQHSLVSVFTPSLMSAEDLEHIFVQREPLAQDLIRRIVDSTKGRGKEHSLLIGMRGMGKTHLVSLVYHRVKAMPELQDKLLIAWLREEEWGVDSWLDLVMRIFRAVAEDRGSADSGMAQDLLDQFYKDGFESAKGSATKFLRDLIGKRTLLLIIENMDDLFQGLGEQGQQEFRAFLQEYRCCTVLATTPAMFRGVESREMPFYGFFHPCYLESIKVDEAVKMLGQIAGLTTVRDEHHDLATYLQSAEGRARVRAVHHLAGGNPRVYTLFAQFMTRESLDDLVDAFMKMLDDLTPYYQARMKELSNQQRKIVELLVDRRQAVMVKDIGDTCFIDQRAVASQLRELKKKGYVVSNEVGRESFYELREVLMRFCMEVKKFRGRWIEMILDFLKVWYRPEQREGLLEKFGDSKLMNRHDLERAFLSDDDPVGAICIRKFRKSLQENNQFLALQIAEELHSLQILEDTEYQKFMYLTEEKKYQEALILLDVSQSSEDKYLKPVSYFQMLLQGWEFYKSGKFSESVIAFDLAITMNPYGYQAWESRGLSLHRLGRDEEAIVSYNHAVTIKTDTYNSWHDRGCQQFITSDYQAAILSWRQAFEYIRDPEEPRYYDVSQLIQEFIEALIPRFTQPPIQQTLLIPLLEIYKKSNVITELGAALVNTLHLIVAPTISDHTANQWLSLWRTSSLGNEPAMELPLRLMSTAIEYKKDPSKRQRLWLNLPSEERPILDKALKMAS